MLAAYGTHAIDAITAIINSSTISDKVKTHGLKVIEDIRKNSTLN
jgi:hypothetical protein